MKCIYCNNETQNNKFCSRKCAATYNNKKIIKRKLLQVVCYKCGTPIIRNSWKDKRKVCSSCKYSMEIKHNGRCFTGRYGKVDWSKVTYEDMIVSRKYQKNSRIRQLARIAYKKSNKPLKCLACGYDKHIEICHNPAISSYPKSTPISTINSLDNLIALCPNHHWEFDNGFLKL